MPSLSALYPAIVTPKFDGTEGAGGGVYAPRLLLPPPFKLATFEMGALFLDGEGCGVGRGVKVGRGEGVTRALCVSFADREQPIINASHRQPIKASAGVRFISILRVEVGACLSA